MKTLEEQIMSIADEAFAQTEPVDLAERHLALDFEPVDLVSRHRPARRKRLLAMAAAFLLVALVGGLMVATGGDNDPVPVDDPNGLSVIGSLGDLPIEIEERDNAIDGDLRIAGVNLLAVEQLTATMRPSTYDATGPWARMVAGDANVAVPSSELFREAITNAEGFAAEMPFVALDVGGYVTASVNGLSAFDVFALSQRAESVESAAGDDNFIKVGDAEPGQRNIADRTQLRPVGEPLLVGVDPKRDQVAVTREPDFLPAWLDGSGDSMSSASSGVLVVAEQLDGMDGLYGFEILERDFSINRVPTVGLQGVDEMVIVDRPFSLLGVGYSGIDTSARNRYVYLFDDDADAAAARPSVDAMFAPGNAVLTPPDADELTMGSVYSVESIETVGRTVVVTVMPSPEFVEGLRAAPPIFYHR